MKKILTLLLIGGIIYACFRQLGDKFVYGWLAGMIYGLISDLISKKP